MLVQTQHRLSVADYYRMAETGVLKPDARVELLDGKIIDMSQMAFPDVAVDVAELFKLEK